jgi:hypothetical protein
MSANTSPLLQLHIAEYEALTTRASYSMAMQAGLIALAPGFAVLDYYLYQVLASAQGKSLISWGTVFVLHLVALIWANMMLEQFSMVRYIECYLRPRIQDTVGDERFWLYEPYLIKHRPVNTIWGHYSMVGTSLMVLATLVLIRLKSFSRWDAGGLAINAALLIILFRMSKGIPKLQRAWTKCNQRLMPLVDVAAEECVGKQRSNL